MTTIRALPTEGKCQRRLHQLVFGTEACPFCQSTLTYIPSYAWCKRCRRKVRVRAVTWLRSSKLSFRTLFVLLLAWQGKESPGAVYRFTGLSYPTIARWYARFRLSLPRGADPLDGVAEVDEAFFGRRKFGHQTIVAGVVVREGTLRLGVVNGREEALRSFVGTHLARGAPWF